MNRCLFPMLSTLLILLVLATGVKAQDSANETILPAGTLLRCTLDEPNFSSKTADVGDPVLCPLSGVLLFSRSAFPRGAYLGGHLVAAKDPGHFVGKGYLQLEFDHIGLPDDQIPVPAKIIAAAKYRVDKEGKIIGHGHPKRDAVEWAIPLLWPLKVMTLPARGPRPTLKGEQQLTLRLMDDVALPAQPMPGWHYFEKPSSQNLPPRSGAARQSGKPETPPEARQNAANSQFAETQPAQPSQPPVPRSTARNILILRNGRSYLASSLHIDGGQISYLLSDGTSGAVGLNEIDWTRTLETNAENGSAFAAATDSNGQ